MKVSGVYKITNTITGDFYIGSSKNVKSRWASHKKSSTWSRCPNNPMYLDFQKYGVENFEFEILEEVEIDRLKETEQQFIEKMHPTYNSNRANGWDIDRYKENKKEYYQQNRENKKEYYQQNRKKRIEYQNKYRNQLCCYNGEELTLNALTKRFKRAGIEHCVLEAKKYLIKKESNNVIEFYDVFP